jgi:formate hydrogenlyase transcriptional activator
MLSAFPSVKDTHISARVKTMRDFEADVAMMERELIVDALDHSRGRVSGEGGAAEKLAMHPKTLYSRIDKLAIRKRYQ